ncbi:MAG: ABC transporter ATP-binding protein [Bacteroidales bacterium]
MKPLIQIKDLSIGFISDNNYHQATESVNLCIEHGKTLGIVGESGSGKSVTALSILRLLPAAAKIDSGEIIFSGKDDNTINLLKISNKDIQKIRGNKIGMIFQEPMTSLNPVMKCGKQVTESMILHLGYTFKEAKQRTLELFNEVMLPRPESIFNSYPHQISGGQKQRVMIAMAVACNPALLIADEPTTALDVTVQKSILTLMKVLQQKYNMGMLYISHDLGVVANIADDVAVMYRGKIVETGKADQVFNHPEHPYTKGLIACRPGMSGRPEKLPVVADFINAATNTDDVLKIPEITPEKRAQEHKRIYNSEPFVNIENLKVYFEENTSLFNFKKKCVKAVDNISFDVFKGETLGLVGESGSGKTTLGRALLGLIKANDGKISFNGLDLKKLPHNKLRKLRQNMQIIFQDPYSSLNPRITIGEAIEEPMKVHGLYKSHKERQEKVVELLERVGLKPEHYHRYPHEFSGGQRQRICIARALALNPGFIICDESVSALDVSIQAQVLNLLNKLKKDYGFTYIFISHDLSVVRYMSDRMIVMKNGKIIESGESDTLISNPESDYTRSLIEALPVFS